MTATASVGLVLAGLAAHWGGTVSTIAGLLFLTSNFAALLSFHNGVARYLFALGRERVLPVALSRVGTRSGGPVAGSLAQTALAVVVLTIFVLSGTDPVLEMFTWLSGISAVGVVLLMAGHIRRGRRLLPRQVDGGVDLAAGSWPLRSPRSRWSHWSC